MRASRGSRFDARTVRALGWAAAAAIACLLPGAPAAAHDGGNTAYAAITVNGATVRYALTVGDLPPGPVARAIGHHGRGKPVDHRPLIEAISRKVALQSQGGACTAGPGHGVPPGPGSMNVTAIVDFVCPRPLGDLVIVDNLFDLLGADLHTLARIETPLGVQQFAFSTDAREARIPVDRPAAQVQSTWSFLLLGFEHILLGYDHLLFVLALVICGGRLRHLLLVITAFTLAHSLTLGLAVTGLVTVPGNVVEPLIALSIAYVAAENLFPRIAVSRRFAVSFIFGLVHGFGFAGILQDMALPTSNLLLSLLGFNLGVELGQALVLVVILPLVMLTTGQKARSPLAAPVSSVVLALGLFLFVERVLA